jgi:hypothetical protein
MSLYTVDRFKLESKSTEEILRILKEERDDYTEDALRIFEEILEARGVDRRGSARISGAGKGQTVPSYGSGDSPAASINSPAEAVIVLNDLLDRVLKGTLDPATAQVAANMVMMILQALEQDFLRGEPEETP